MDNWTKELLRAKRQLDHEINICVFRWIDHAMTDQEFARHMSNAGQVFMERMAPHMGREPK